MMRYLTIILLGLVFATFANGQEADDAAGDPEVAVTEQQPANEDDIADDNGDGIDSPKTMSGMSILGNEEAPKSLVIIPWKSSKLGDDISLSDTLDDRAQPVDKEVFLRELRFYELRSDERT